MIEDFSCYFFALRNNIVFNICQHIFNYLVIVEVTADQEVGLDQQSPGSIHKSAEVLLRSSVNSNRFAPYYMGLKYIWQNVDVYP